MSTFDTSQDSPHILVAVSLIEEWLRLPNGVELDGVAFDHEPDTVRFSLNWPGRKGPQTAILTRQPDGHISADWDTETRVLEEEG